MDQRKRSDLALGSFLRLQLGWSPTALPEIREEAIKAASLLIKTGENDFAGKPFDMTVPHYLEYRDIILASIGGRAAYDHIEDETTKQMEALAKTLPIWEWASDVRGFGARSVAVIVAEAGNLANYATKGKLWKRMGLAVIDGRRQGNPLSKDADSWIEHGYSPRRRSYIYVIGDVLIKVGERYREIYLKRKDVERAKAEEAGLIVVPAAKIPKADAAKYISEGHIHNRARRFMEKRLLLDMWRQWNHLQVATTIPGVATNGHTSRVVAPVEAVVPAEHATSVAKRARQSRSQPEPPPPTKGKSWKFAI